MSCPIKLTHFNSTAFQIKTKSDWIQEYIKKVNQTLIAIDKFKYLKIYNYSFYSNETYCERNNSLVFKPRKFNLYKYYSLYNTAFLLCIQSSNTDFLKLS